MTSIAAEAAVTYHAAVQAVLDLHQPDEWAGTQLCAECRTPHPCPTVQAIRQAVAP